MTKFIPIFPLSLVVYPGQPLNLHIFEPRYKQLVKECNEEGKTFGIPCVIKDSLTEYGTEVEILEIAHTYENGEMDIKTIGRKIFRVMEVVREVPDKLYSGAIVYEVPHLPFDTNRLNPTLEDLVNRLHRLTGSGFDLRTKYLNPLSYELAHYVGLSIEDQYRLLSSVSERGRQWFLIEHLRQLISKLEQIEQVKARIQMNGHFRKEIPPKF